VAEGRNDASANTPRVLLWLITLAVPLVVIASCEGLARVALSSGAAPDPRLTLVDIPRFFERTEIDGKPHYRIAHDEVYSRRGVVFDAEKPPDTLRVFCLGGSASAGWPHPKQEIYSAYLEQGLQRAFPHKRIQVINASAHAYAAYRVRLIFDQVIELDPDLIVVWSGNNEFLEKRTYLPTRESLEPLLDVANQLASFRVARAWLGPRLFPDNALSGEQRQHTAYAVWSKIKQVALDLRADPEQFSQVKSHYRLSIESMVKRAAETGVPVLLVSVPVNLRDWHPNVSQHALSGMQRVAWKIRYDAARVAVLDGDPQLAVRHFRAALERDPGHAESHFLLARALEQTGDPAGAIQHFQRARDLDHNPFRAISDFNASLREIAVLHPNAYLADAETAFSQASAPYAPGFDLFLDYVHPARAGNLIVAETVFDRIVENDLLGRAREESFQASPRLDYDESQDLTLQLAMIMLFAMMHQDESLVSRAVRYASPRVPHLAIADAVLKVFPEAMEVERERLLGREVDPARAKLAAAKVDHFYKVRFPLLQKAEAAGAGD
jgi:tetratricopeptide (TPR) repeat protein